MTDSNTENKIIESFLNAMAVTATEHQFEKHMSLISKKVEVYGVPGFEKIGYDDWSRQCEKEFKEKLIKQVRYQDIYTIKASDSVIMFNAIELIETTENIKKATTIEIVISLEHDENENKQEGCWRVTQERILSAG